MSSRFVSEKSLQEAQERRKQEWTETYERLGQKPPEEVPDETYDPRPLWEKLREKKDKKQEDFEEKMKFKNQFRGIDDEEAAYLADVSAEKLTAEQARQEEIDQELAAFRERKMTRSTNEDQAETSKSQATPTTQSSGANASTSTAANATTSAPASKKKKEKKSLKGIVVKKKSAGAGAEAATGRSEDAVGQKRKDVPSTTEGSPEGEDNGILKRPRTSEGS